MMSAFECYKHYVALKNHFTRPSYDYFKYQGKSKASVKSFETRPDKLFFAKVAKHEDPLNFMLANLIENDKAWIRDIAYSEQASKIYNEWQRRQQSLSYLLNQELAKLDEDFNSNFVCKDNTHPIIIRLFLQNKISIETLTILSKMVGCIGYWKRKMEYDPVAQEVIQKINKYEPFIKYDREKIKNIVVDKFSEV